MLSEIQLAITSLTGAKTIAAGILSERDASKIAQAVDDLQQRITDARNTIFSLQDSLEAKKNELASVLEEKRNLEVELRQALQNANQFEGYELEDIAFGTFVYAKKRPGSIFRRPPYLCPACKHQGKQSILHFQQNPARLLCAESDRHSLVLPKEDLTSEDLGDPFNRLPK